MMTVLMIMVLMIKMTICKKIVHAVAEAGTDVLQLFIPREAERL